MSIIHDALKKAGSDSHVTRIGVAGEPRSTGLQLWLAIGAAGAVLASLSIAILVALMVRTLAQESEYRTIPGSEVVARQPQAPQQRTARSVPAPAWNPLISSLDVSGIVHVDGESWAVIDGDILRTGDQVAGAHVVRINEENVVLRRNGEDFLLRVR